jgi:hypothetical protein
MQKLSAVGIRVGAIGVAAALCTGCPNPQIYGTPRTTPVGKIQHTVAAEGFNFGIKYPAIKAADGSTTVPERTDSATLPNLPTYQLRVGVADTVDIGVRLANMTSLGADVKWNFIKGDTFDMAAVPGFQVFHIGSSSSSSGSGATAGYTQFYANLPLVFGINVSEAVTIVPTAGVTYGLNSASVVSNDGSSAASSVDGLMLRGGLGFNFRISPRFAMQPEITMLKFLNKSEDAGVTLILFGLGFNFGNLPEYGSKEEAPPPAK